MTQKTLPRTRPQRVAAGGLVAAALLAAGCEPPGPPDTTLFDSPDCTETLHLGLDGIRPAVPVDALLLRQRIQSDPPLILSSSGNECATAGDPDACYLALSVLPTAPGFHPCQARACGFSLATTRGDLVTAYNDSRSLTGFLGALDTPMDAILFVFAQGYSISCTDKALGSVRAALDGDGYEVLGSLPEPSCPPVITGYQLRVTRGGELSFLNRWPVTPPPGLPCE